MRESLENSENRLTREYARENEPELLNALLRKHRSWAAGLKAVGLAPKIYAITASKRTRRGFVFQEFFREMLLRYGFTQIPTGTTEIGSREFTYGNLASGCHHTPRCKPDFLFVDFIIDTKTGGNAKRQEKQIERYLEHRSTLYIVTLRGNTQTRQLQGGKLILISFNRFVAESKTILGVQLDSTEEHYLSETLRKNPFWL